MRSPWRTRGRLRGLRLEQSRGSSWKHEDVKDCWPVVMFSGQWSVVTGSSCEWTIEATCYDEASAAAAVHLRKIATAG